MGKIQVVLIIFSLLLNICIIVFLKIIKDKKVAQLRLEKKQ